jgi:hypothetical protein
LEIHQNNIYFLFLKKLFLTSETTKNINFK